MQFVLVLPFDRVLPDGEFLSAQAIRQIGQTAEQAGFDAVAVTDHPAPTGRWLDHGGHQAQDPFAMLGFLAAVTERVRLHTAILVLPYRNPFLTVRALNSLDIISGGRVTAGIGAGYLKGEYKALGVDFDRRNDITDEYLRAMLAAWSDEEFTFNGTGYTALGNRILPLPVQKPHIPLWMGGNSKRAIRRAVEFGDVWCPFNTGSLPNMAATSRTAPISGVDDLAAGLAYLKEQSEKAGRTRPPGIMFDGGLGHAPDFNAGALIDRVGQLTQLGVSSVSLHIQGRDRSEWCDNAARFGAEIIRRIRRER